MVCEGEDSGNSGFTDFKKVADSIPGGTYHLVHKAGHLIPMEKPEETFSIISRFTRSIFSDG
jgi:pimeloyl-ACP methyl ester carboxylesterase